MLHDLHKIPQPVLAITGLTYLFPFYLAVRNNRVYDASTYIFLTFTTLGFHGTRNEIVFVLDCFAILNFLLRTSYLALKSSKETQCFFYLSLVYAFTSYIVGKYYKIMSFHPDWNTQIAYHSIIHISSSYTAYIIMKEIADEKANILLMASV